MKIWLEHTTNSPLDLNQLGGKAFRLLELKSKGYNVPDLLVLPADVIHQLNSNGFQLTDEDWRSLINQLSDEKHYAVRSSGVDEDGSSFSFAGMYSTILEVEPEKIKDAVFEVAASVKNARRLTYTEKHDLDSESRMAVIIQEMVDADISGVAFGIDPVTVEKGSKVISCVRGLGEQLVSGQVDSENYRISPDGTILRENLIGEGLLTDNQIRETEKILLSLEKIYGTPQDIEFSFKNGVFYLLQSRNVTTFDTLVPQQNKIVWDNSNIIESYPGVSSPMTFSFIRESYQVAYSLFGKYLGVPQKMIDENNEVFANTLGYLNGRVYYNLRSWYLMLAMLPGYRINARFMEGMMGVKERFDVPAEFATSKLNAWMRLIKAAVTLIWRYLRIDATKREFWKLLNKVIAEYEAYDLNSMKATEILLKFRSFEKRLLLEWKAPLLNDFFAMIWFGRLQKGVQAVVKDENSNLHNDLLCGCNDIISVQPIHRTREISSYILKDEELAQVFKTSEESVIQAYLKDAKNENWKELDRLIKLYLRDFGERCFGELKLETRSYANDPLAYLSIVKSFVAQGLDSEMIDESRDIIIREAAEKELFGKLKGRPWKKYRIKKLIRRARSLVSDRENLRFERTRAFGMVRKMLNAIGKDLANDGLIEDAHDIFFLSKQELFDLAGGTAVTKNIKGLIALRKEEQQEFLNTQVLPERVATFGMATLLHEWENAIVLEEGDGQIKGIGCCPGIVRAKVMVIHDPREVQSLDGSILVTMSTDPGWVTLFPSASGIIVERGSLLSHSAIVAREMGIPCIVSVNHLLQKLKTGDLVEMDGKSGKITLVEKDE